MRNIDDMLRVSYSKVQERLDDNIPYCNYSSISDWMQDTNPLPSSQTNETLGLGLGFGFGSDAGGSPSSKMSSVRGKSKNGRYAE